MSLFSNSPAESIWATTRQSRFCSPLAKPLAKETRPYRKIIRIRYIRIILNNIIFPFLRTYRTYLYRMKRYYRIIMNTRVHHFSSLAFQISNFWNSKLLKFQQQNVCLFTLELQYSTISTSIFTIEDAISTYDVQTTRLPPYFWSPLHKSIILEWVLCVPLWGQGQKMSN